jgi:alpha-tubulin suppressor-like RCC1 family protein
VITTVTYLPNLSFSKMLVGSTFVYALDNLSYAWAWGIGTNGQLGNNSISTGSLLPVSVAGGYQFIQSIAGSGTELSLNNLSYAYAWGQGANGVLGNNSTANASSPVSVVGDHQFTQIASGSIFLALDDKSYAYAWGAGTNGRLGNNSTADASSPVSVVGGYQFTQIANTGNITDALDGKSYAYAWGIGTGGQLGNNAAASSSSPVSVVGGHQFTQIAINVNTVYALDNLSYAYAWGQGANGVLGNNSTANASSPVSVVGDHQFTKIASAAASVTYALDNLSYAYAWGIGTSGVLGNNSTANASSPVSVVGGHQFTQIATASSNACALDDKSYAYAWGVGTDGVLGNNAAASSSSPVSVVGGHQFTQIAVRGTNMYGFNSVTGTIYTWGINDNGQLGMGGNVITSTSSPVLVVGPGNKFQNSNFIAVTPGTAYSITIGASNNTFGSTVVSNISGSLQIIYDQ